MSMNTAVLFEARVAGSTTARAPDLYAALRYETRGGFAR